MNKIFMFFAIIGLSAVIGCGSGSKVTGKVTYSDGSPLTVGKVMFSNGSVTASGKINDSGDYKMDLGGNGLPDGKYQVYVTEALMPDDKFRYKDEDGNMTSPLALVIDPKFASASKSGLECNVKGSTTFDIKVEKPPKGYSPVPDLSEEASKAID